jgi:hypothetical protein
LLIDWFSSKTEFQTVKAAAYLAFSWDKNLLE